jgi:hypothetical protein
LLVVEDELEVVFVEPVPVAVARVVAAVVVDALVDVDEELVVEVSIRMPPVEEVELVPVFEEVVGVELDETLELLSPELELPPEDLMLCQLPLSSL